MAVIFAQISGHMVLKISKMSMNEDVPPPEYIVKDCSFGCLESSPNPISAGAESLFSIIDVGLLTSPPSSASSFSKADIDNELDKLRSALSAVGCIQVIGHGISNSLLDKIRDVANEFFALPDEEKQKYRRAANESEGYGTDRIVSDKQVQDWLYRLTLKVLPQHKRRPNLWPKFPNDFEETLEEFVSKTKILNGILFKAMARSIGLEEDRFVKQFGDGAMMQARFNFYPPCSRPDLVLGIKPHTDKSGLTVLLQDKQVEGLQVLVDKKWFNVPVIPYALVINLGDQMQIMSNGIFKSPMHRVLTNSKNMRISVALFDEPDPEREIGPVDSLVDDEQRPRLYRNVKDYGAINYECYQKGMVALDTVKI